MRRHVGRRGARHHAAFTLSMLLCFSSTAFAQQAILRYDSTYHPITGQHGMVVSQREAASRIGAEVLSRGGNAVDAAVATGFALAVTLPRAGNIGGGGFMLIYSTTSGTTTALDFRERAPALAHQDMFVDRDGSVNRDRYHSSHQSVGVPGTVAGLTDALALHGSLPLKELIKPSIDLAQKGIRVSYDLASAIVSRAEKLTRHPNTAKTFFREDGSAYEPGDLFRQPQLAGSLERIARLGVKGFYEGITADLIVAEMQRGDGLITHEDLKNYRSTPREAVTGSYRGYTIVSMPPPSSGGVHLIQMLNMLEQFTLRQFGHNSAQTLHIMTEVMKIAYADRSRHLGDPDFVDVAVDWLTSKAYAVARITELDTTRARPSNEISPGTRPVYESEDTTHYSVIDASGNAVAVTYTLNFSFGNGITVPGAGFLLNNEMSDFSAKPGVPDAFGLVTGEANKVAPDKRPLSAMTPTMVLKNGKPFLVTGSPGGSKIINVVLQNIVNVIDFDMDVATAVNTPRIHHQWQPDILNYEPGISVDTIELLTQLGHPVTQSSTLGSVQAILWDDKFYGSADPRRPGAAASAAKPVARGTTK